MLHESLLPYRYCWPTLPFRDNNHWKPVGDRSPFLAREMPEPNEELAKDSRWPAFFPSPICLVTTANGGVVALEKVVGASIVNRFPYVMALSFCTRGLSGRHYARTAFTRLLEQGGQVAVQFVRPGPDLDRVMQTIASIPDQQSHTRVAATGLPSRQAVTNIAPVFESAYLVYEARLVCPGRDFYGNSIYTLPWVDVGSHRVYFLEINAIQLRSEIAHAQDQIHWHSLPAWQPQMAGHGFEPGIRNATQNARYQKGYTPNYVFPSTGTIAFEYDRVESGMAIKQLPPLPKDQVEVDNDRARWPCFFPSSAGIITTWTDDGTPNVMPCGSTTIVSRQPLVVTPCVSYAPINERYAPRTSLSIIRKRKRFVCGVPYISEEVVNAMKYTGNTSLALDPDKVANAGLQIEEGEYGPILPALPVHFECEVTGEVALGTHIMFLGEVRRIRVRTDVTPDNPLEWCPWPTVLPSPTGWGQRITTASLASKSDGISPVEVVG